MRYSAVGRINLISKQTDPFPGLRIYDAKTVEWELNIEMQPITPDVDGFYPSSLLSSLWAHSEGKNGYVSWGGGPWTIKNGWNNWPDYGTFTIGVTLHAPVPRTEVTKDQPISNKAQPKEEQQDPSEVGDQSTTGKTFIYGEKFTTDAQGNIVVEVGDTLSTSANGSRGIVVGQVYSGSELAKAFVYRENPPPGASNSGWGDGNYVVMPQHVINLTDPNPRGRFIRVKVTPLSEYRYRKPTTEAPVLDPAIIRGIIPEPAKPHTTTSSGVTSPKWPIGNSTPKNPGASGSLPKGLVSIISIR